MNDFITGLQIFAKYGCSYIGTDYYGIFAGDTRIKYSKEDRKTLKDCEWNKDETRECFYHFV